MGGESLKLSYSRREVERLLKVTRRQLRSWEKQGLVPSAESYGFTDLLAIRTLVKLRQDRVSTAKIRQALAALREKLAEVENPLAELKIFRDGRRILVQVGRQTLVPASGQLLLDFGEEELARLVSFPTRRERRGRPAEGPAADRLFQQALELEQQGAFREAIRAYEQVTEADPEFAGAFVNLGTLYFNAREFDKAESYYRRAVEADPHYALAHFNLGNLYDELGDRARSLLEYQRALRLDPNYADAHYNIALLYQSAGQPLRAVYHWKTYLKLDPTSSWAPIARRELDRLYRETVVGGPSRDP